MSRINKHFRSSFVIGLGLMLTAPMILSGCNSSTDSEGSNNEFYKEDQLYMAALDQIQSGSQGANQELTTVTKGVFIQKAFMDGELLYPDSETVSVESSAKEAEITLNTDTVAFKSAAVMNGQYVEKGAVLFTYTLAHADEITIASEERSLTREEEDYYRYTKDQNESFQSWAERIAEMEDGGDKTREFLSYNQSLLSYQESVTEKAKALEKHRTQIANMKDDQDYDVVAPISGIVALRNRSLREGDDLAISEVVFDINSSEKVIIRVEDPDGKLRYNQSVEITCTRGRDSKDNATKYEGRVVSSVGNVSNQMADTMDNNSYVEFIGDTTGLTGESMENNTQSQNWWEWDENKDIHISIVAEDVHVDDVLLVSNSAVALEKENPFVVIYDENGTHKRFFQSGGTNGKVYWILSGLEEGTRVLGSALSYGDEEETGEDVTGALGEDGSAEDVMEEVESGEDSDMEAGSEVEEAETTVGEPVDEPAQDQ